MPRAAIRPHTRSSQRRPEDHAMPDTDTALHRAVMEALAGNPRVRADEIAVETVDDRGDITLRGTVGSVIQQSEAMRTAARVPGVRHVDDGLAVRSWASTDGPTPTRRPPCSTPWT